MRSGRFDEADLAYGRAVDLATNDAEREHLIARRAAISG